LALADKQFETYRIAQDKLIESDYEKEVIKLISNRNNKRATFNLR